MIHRANDCVCVWVLLFEVWHQKLSVFCDKWTHLRVSICMTAPQNCWFILYSAIFRFSYLFCIRWYESGVFMPWAINYFNILPHEQTIKKKNFVSSPFLSSLFAYFFFSYLNSMCQMISISTHTFHFFYHSNSIHCIPLGCIRFKVQLQHIYHSLWSTVFTTTISIIFFSSDKHKNFTADRVRRQSLR